MKKQLVRFIVFCLMFVLSTLGVMLYQQWPFFMKTGPSGSMAISNGGLRWGYNVPYTSLTGVPALFVRLNFENSDYSKKYFNKEIQSSTGILNHELIYDDTGREVIMEKVTLSYMSRSETEQEEFAIVCLMKSNVYSFISTSVYDVQLFEKSMMAH